MSTSTYDRISVTYYTVC